MDQHPPSQNPPQPIKQKREIKTIEDFNKWYQQQLATKPPGYSAVQNLKRKHQENKRREQAQIEKSKQRLHHPEQQNKKPIQNQQTFIKTETSQRVKKASQGHQSLLEQINRKSQPSQKPAQKTFFLNQQKNVNPQNNEDHSKFNNLNNSLFNNSIKPSNSIFAQPKNQLNTIFANQSKKIQPATNNSSIFNNQSMNPFIKPTQIQQPGIATGMTNIFSKKTDQQKVQAPKLNIFQNKSVVQQTKQPLFANSYTNNQSNSIFGSKTPFSSNNGQSNQVLPKPTEPVKPFQTGLFSNKPINLFLSNSNNAFPTNNLFTRVNNQENHSNMIHQNQVQNQSIANPQNQAKQIQQRQRILQIQKPKVNIFAQGLFQNVKEGKQKPSLVFNNNIVKPVNPTNTQVQTKKQPFKLLFNNNGGTVQNIKPSVNIFTGEFIPNQQNSQPIEVQIQQSPAKKSLFNPQEKKQDIKSTNPFISSGSLFSSNLNNQNKQKQVPKSQIKQQKQMDKIPLFSKPLFNAPSNSTPSLFNTTNNNSVGLFSSNSVKPQLAVNENNQTTQSGLFSSSKNQNKPLAQPQLNTNVGLFGSNKPKVNQQPNTTGSLFGNNTPKDNEKTPQPNTNVGLFGNISQKTSQQTAVFNQVTQKLNPNVQKKPTNSLFANSASTNNMFSKPTQNKQDQPQQQNIFKRTTTQTLQPNTSNNPFAKVFSQPAQSGNIFKSSLNTGQSLFGNTGKSLFGNTLGQNMFANTKPAVNFDQNEEDQDDQQGDQQIQSSEPEVVEGQMKFNYDQPQIIFPRSQVIKFKDPYKPQNNLIQNVKISIQRFPSSQQGYMIVRTPNKQPIFIGFFLKQSEVGVMKKKQSVSIQKMLQNKDGQIIKVQGLRILFKSEDDAKKFVSQANKIISNKKNQNK